MESLRDEVILVGQHRFVVAEIQEMPPGSIVDRHFEKPRVDNGAYLDIKSVGDVAFEGGIQHYIPSQCT